MIELRMLLSMLQGVQGKGNGQYMAKCPCHEDHKASLAVREGDKGIVLHCQAGCDTGDIVRRLGLEMRDLMAEDATGGAKTTARRAPAPRKAQAPADPPAPKAKRAADLKELRVGGEYVHKGTLPDGSNGLIREKITRAYDYQDEHGTVVLKVFRTVDKSFPVVHLDGGGWYWGDGGKTDLMYRLPQVLEAVRTGETVYITEGEKDVETLERLGLVATCNKGGAGKWAEKLTAALEGAQVVIVPDVDEAGKHHAQLVARKLAGHAREVRVVNLRRAHGAKLGDKGDISDLAAAMGDPECRMELARLVAASPVLSRVVSDDDYADWFEGIRGCTVKSGSICTYRAGNVVPLSNFVALPVEEVLLDDGSGEKQYRVKIAGWSAMGYRLRTLDVSLAEFDQMAWPLKLWGISANIAEENGAKQKLRRIIQEAGQRAAVRREVYSHTGWRQIDGKWVFLHGNGAVGADAEVRLEFGLERYVLDGLVRGPWVDEAEDVKASMCQCTLLSAISAPGLRIGVPLAGFMFLAPLRHFLGERNHRPSFVPYLRGGTGSGKSSVAALFLNLFGRDFSFETTMPASFEDTANGISLKLYQLKDLPLLVDDLHPETDARRARSMFSVAETVSRMVGDGMVRSRMRADATAQVDRPARGLVLETGEQIPQISPSGVARLYVIDVRKGDVPVPIRTGMESAQGKKRMEGWQELCKQASWGALNEVMRGYIAWLAEQAITLPDQLDAELDQLRAEAMDKMGKVHARIPTAMAYLMLGCRMMLKYLSESGVGVVSAEDLPELERKYWLAVTSNANEQVVEMADSAPTEIFLSTVRELLQSGRCVVQDAGVGGAKAVAPPGLIGYRDDNYYYLNPGQTFGAVQRSLADQGQSMYIGKGQTFKQLADEGKLVRDTRTGKNVRQYNRGGVHAWMLWLPRWVIDGGKPVDRLAQQAFIPVAPGDSDNPFEREVPHDKE